MLIFVCETKYLAYIFIISLPFFEWQTKQSHSWIGKKYLRNNIKKLIWFQKNLYVFECYLLQNFTIKFLLN